MDSIWPDKREGWVRYLKVWCNSDGWLCNRYPENIPIDSNSVCLEIGDDEDIGKTACKLEGYAWRVVEGRLECQQYEVKQWTDAERTAERASLHKQTDDDCMKYLRNIRLNIDTEYSNKCIEYIDSYNQAVSDTVNSPDYPQNVVYPEYKLPERED